MELEGDNNSVLFKKKDSNEDEPLTQEDLWNDEMLIAEYDESIKKVQRKLATKLRETSSISDSDCSTSQQKLKIMNGMSSSKPKKKKGKKKAQWHTGDKCRACYSEDGEMYEATIIGINQTEGTCTVRYWGFNNHESVEISSLVKSAGDKARKEQQLAVDNDASYEQYSGETNEYPNSDRKTKKSRNIRIPSETSVPVPTNPLRNGDPLPRMPHLSMPHLPDLPPPPALGLLDGGDPISSEAMHTMLMSWYMTGYHTGYYQGLSHGRKSVTPKKHR